MKRNKINLDQEAIMESLNESLGINISVSTNPDIVAQIEKLNERYMIMKSYGAGKPALEVIDNALIALQEVMPSYLLFLEIDWKEVSKRFHIEGRSFELKEKDIPESILYSKQAEKRAKKLYALINDLINVRKKVKKVIEDLHPIIKLPTVEAESWLSWSLWNLLKETFTGRKIRNKQIDYATYRLLKLLDVEKKESKDPANMIRMRIHRFEKKLTPLVLEELIK